MLRLGTCWNVESWNVGNTNGFGHHFNVFQHWTFSTLQRFNINISTLSTVRQFNIFSVSTLQPFSISTFQNFNSSTMSTVSTCSTFQHFNISRFQHFNMFNISTFQLPLKANKCSTFQCLTSALKVEGSDSNASRFWSQIRELAGWPGLAESRDF